MLIDKPLYLVDDIFSLFGNGYFYGDRSLIFIACYDGVFYTMLHEWCSYADQFAGWHFDLLPCDN